jgi:6-phosphogluconolactonase
MTTKTSKEQQLIPRLLVCINPEEVATRAAALFVSQAVQAIADRGRFRVVLSGGSTPRRAYELLTSPRWSSKIRWEAVEVFWGDERYVSAEDADSNYRMAREAFLERVPLPEANIHPVPTGIEPAEAAAAYEETIRATFAATTDIPRFDLIFLGLGANGHTASLFPASPLLRETSRLVAADYVQELDGWRVTMTAPLLNRGRTIAFLVTGQDKAGVLREVVRGPYVPEVLPAQLIRPEDAELLWIADTGAASLIMRT